MRQQRVLKQGEPDVVHLLHISQRNQLTRLLQCVGQVDETNTEDVVSCLEQLSLCLLNLVAYNSQKQRSVLPVLTRLKSSLTSRWQDSQLRQQQQINGFIQDIEVLRRLPSLRRLEALRGLYASFALFVADTLTLMHLEENEILKVLRECLSDEQLADLERQWLVSLSPEEAKQQWQILVDNLQGKPRQLLLQQAVKLTSDGLWEYLQNDLPPAADSQVER